MLAAFVSAIEEVGAEPVRYESPLHQKMPGPPRVLTGSFFANFRLRLLEEALAVAPALEEHLAGDLPQLISPDSMGPYGARVLGYAWGTPLAALTPSLVSNEHFSLWGTFAKLGATAPAGDDPMISEFQERFAAFATGHGVPADRVGPMGRAFAPGDEAQIVFVPRWFQPAGDTFDDRYSFVGPCLTERAYQGEWQPPGTGPVLGDLAGHRVQRPARVLPHLRRGVRRHAMAGRDVDRSDRARERIDLAFVTPPR